ncbi:hypothetical protein C8R42DRAFT_656893 [Lentinula raphanica]|nr:hypothetical protein C8R42DRAFT_656893 [Lentinula raphanica]
MDNTHLYDPPAAGLTIGTPRMMSPRSHRTHRSIRSQRSPQPPAYNNDDTRGDVQAVVAGNLHRNDSPFNLDPDAPVLGAGGESIQEAINAEEQREELRKERNHNFVGGFMVGLKRALKPTWHDRQRSDPEAAYAQTPYTADSTYSPAPNPAGFGQQQVYPHADHSHPSASSDSQVTPSSETIHGTQEMIPDDGTTAIDHRAMPMSIATPSHYVSPIVVEPQLAPDYIKMGSRSSSSTEVSLNSYMSRLAQFFQHINELPWVAENRVTVDYCPGESNKRHARSRPPRKVLSWYNRHVFPPTQNTEILDLDAGSSPSPPGGQVVQMVEAQPVFLSNTEQKGQKEENPPLILPTVPIPESQINSGPTYLAEVIPLPIPLPLPRSETQQSARTGRSVVYSVVNPSAPSSSTSTTTSPVLLQPPRRSDNDDIMTALAKSTTGYTPFQPSTAQYGRPIHEPQTLQPTTSSTSQMSEGDIREVPAAHVRAGTPAHSMYPYPLYAPSTGT